MTIKGRRDSCSGYAIIILTNVREYIRRHTMIKVVTILECNICKNTGSQQTTRDTAMVEFVQMVANQKGWITINKNGIRRHICPKCQEAGLENYAGDFSEQV